MSSFKPDPKIAQIAEAYSLDAIDIAKRNFGVTLDWSEESIAEVEVLLGTLHDQIAKAKPDQKTIWIFAKAFGSYVGEIFRKTHGGTWGMVTLDGQEFPGMQDEHTHLFWPWGRAYQRIVEGPQNNIHHYYLSIASQQ